MQIRLIRKYKNRKLYDTKDSCYISLKEIALFALEKENFIVVTSKQNIDITKNTLLEAAAMYPEFINNDKVFTLFT